jgi:signal peptidase I
MMQIKISHYTIEDFLNTEGVILYKVVGKSMEPMLRPNRDLVLIQKKGDTEKISENDVVLYKSNGKLILHRIIKVEGQGKYIILGDNSSRIEKNIPEENIIGILQCFYRDGLLFTTKNNTYLSYVERMRKGENIRIKKKKIYDFILWHFKFLPIPILFRMKIYIKDILNYNYNFE